MIEKTILRVPRALTFSHSLGQYPAPSWKFTVSSEPVAVVIASASALQAAACGLVLRKSIGYPAALDNPRDLLLFLLFSPVVCLISATVSICGMWALGVLSSADSAINLLTWWIGDTLGVLVGLPVTLVLAGEPRRLWQHRAWYVAVPMILCLTLLVAIFIRLESRGLSGGLHTETQIGRSAEEIAQYREWRNWIFASAGTLSIGLLGALLMLGTGYSYRMGAKEKELEAVLRSTPFMLTRCSRDLRFRFVSESYAAMLGKPRCRDATHYGAERKQTGPIGCHFHCNRGRHPRLAGEKHDRGRLVDSSCP
jgi:hypothetical protein